MPSKTQDIRKRRIQWHRLFGLMLMDYLSNRGFRVELEKDLSVKRQPLDVVIVEQEYGEPDVSGICDGFDNLSRHNLLSYKSKRQSLNIWALEELIGHYVNYCKVLGRDGRGKSDDIRLYAVSTRHPKKVLSLSGVTKAKPGVYDLRVLSREIRILEGIAMPYTMEQFRKEYIKAHLGELDLDDRLKGVDPKDVLSRFDPETRLKGLKLNTRE